MAPMGVTKGSIEVSKRHCQRVIHLAFVASLGSRWVSSPKSGNLETAITRIRRHSPNLHVIDKRENLIESFDAVRWGEQFRQRSRPELVLPGVAEPKWQPIKSCPTATGIRTNGRIPFGKAHSGGASAPLLQDGSGWAAQHQHSDAGLPDRQQGTVDAQNTGKGIGFPWRTGEVLQRGSLRPHRGNSITTEAGYHSGLSALPVYPPRLLAPHHPDERIGPWLLLSFGQPVFG